MGHCQGNCSLKVTVRDGRGEGRFEAVSWDEALDELVEQINACNDKHDAGSVLLATGDKVSERSEVYENLGALIGASGVPYHGIGLGILNGIFPGINFAFGCSTCEVNWKDCDAVALLGTNPLESNLTTNAAFMDAKRGGTKFICIDPHFMRMASKSDLWLPVRPGYDAELMMGICSYLIGNNLIDKDYLCERTDMALLINVETGARLRDHEPAEVEGEFGPELEDGAADSFMVRDGATGAVRPYNDSAVRPALDAV